MGTLIKGIKQLICKCFVTLGIKIQVKEALACLRERRGDNLCNINYEFVEPVSK